MVSKTKWEKEELLKILNNSRQLQRCDIQRRLKLEKENITKDINIKIKELEQEKYNILKKHNLLNIDGSKYGCDIISLHLELKVFDEKTNIERKNILRGK